MATMSSARYRSLYRRRKQAHEAVYHFFRELGRSFHRRVFRNPNHRNLASTIRR